ncbi:MAG: chloride channel protein [Candidatus Cyclobacteriaceae bacterium M3_2C_046]
MKFNDILVKFLVWRLKHISNKDFALILSGIIGAISGLAAVILKEAVHFIAHLLQKAPDIAFANYFYLAFPLIGILLTVLFSRYFLKEKLGHGISDVLYSISQKSSIIKRSKTWSRMVTSAMTVGFGGSVGLEAPIVVTGSAIGSNIGQLFHLNYKRRSLLIGCGAAGAISAIFNSPIAGVIFSIEVILAEININAFIPLLIASVAGSLVSLGLLGSDILFTFSLSDSFVASDTPYYILLGIICGMVSVYFTRITYKVEEWIHKFRNYLGRGALGGILVGLIIFVFPPIYGEGYNTIKTLLAGNESVIMQNSFFYSFHDNIPVLLIFLFGVILIKPVASALTIGSGGSGGVFAPSLFIGGVTGFLFAKTLNTIFNLNLVSLSNFTLVGMCGVMSGILHAPLTAIFLIAEITSGYTLFVPLMLVSAISYSTISYFEKYSIYTKNLIERGEYIPDDKDRQVLSLINLKKIIETDLLTIPPDAQLEDLVALVRQSKRNIFPVVDSSGALSGIITLDDVRDIIFEEESRKNITISSLMHQPPGQVSLFESMESVMEKFEESGAWNLPVIDGGKYVGFVSKSRIFNAYRKKIIRQHRDQI